MMTTYTRRGPGQSYLKTVLSERINNLIEHKDLNLEVNPLKVYEQMINQIEEDTGSLPPELPRGVPPETAAANKDVQAIIQPRLGMLMEIANLFMDTIIESLDQVPYGIRWICKQIRSLTKVTGKTSHALCFTAIVMPNPPQNLVKLMPITVLFSTFSASTQMPPISPSVL